MTTTEPSTHVLVEQLQRTQGSELFRDVPDSTGTDPEGVLSVTVDAGRRIVAAQVLDPGRLRTPAAFVEALNGAFNVADGERGLASLEQSGHAEEWLARAEAGIAGHGARRVITPPDVSREASRERRRRREEQAVSARTSPPPPDPVPVTSDNGFLTILRGRDASLRSITVDEGWLLGARPEHLERAILQAATITTHDSRGA